MSVAHAQTTAPTVSTVAVTSDPGTDDTYALGDTIEVGLTFSEAVTVTGAPYLLIDVGGTKRRVQTTTAGPAPRSFLFRYTVLAGDDDDDGIAVVENSLTLNGGTIVATDAATQASLDDAALNIRPPSFPGVLP